MNKGQRIYLQSILVILLAGIFFSCHKPNEISELMAEEDLPFQTTYNGKYTFTEDTKLRNTIEAGKMEHYTKDSSYINFSEGLKLEIFNRSEYKEAELTSRKGWYNEKSQIMWAEDSVEFRNNEGEILKTEKLIWDERKELIYTDLPVQILRQNDTLWGDGIQSNENFTNYSIKNPRGSIFVEEPTENE